MNPTRFSISLILKSDSVFIVFFSKLFTIYPSQNDRGKAIDKKAAVKSKTKELKDMTLNECYCCSLSAVCGTQ